MRVVAWEFFFDNKFSIVVLFKFAFRRAQFNELFIDDREHLRIFEMYYLFEGFLCLFDAIWTIKLYILSRVQKGYSATKQTLLSKLLLFLGHLVLWKHLPSSLSKRWGRFNELIIIILNIPDYISRLWRLGKKWILDWLQVRRIELKDLWFWDIHALVSESSTLRPSSERSRYNFTYIFHLIMEKSALPGFLSKEFNYTIQKRNMLIWLKQLE